MTDVDPQSLLITAPSMQSVGMVVHSDGQGCAVSHRPNNRSKNPHGRRSACQAYVVHGFITVTGQPVA
jgi:hypothetical protein